MLLRQQLDLTVVMVSHDLRSVAPSPTHRLPERHAALPRCAPRHAQRTGHADVRMRSGSTRLNRAKSLAPAPAPVPCKSPAGSSKSPGRRLRPRGNAMIQPLAIAEIWNVAWSAARWRRLARCCRSWSSCAAGRSSRRNQPCRVSAEWGRLSCSLLPSPRWEIRFPHT